MALSIISNQAASIATRSLGQSNDAATATAEKLSSGKRINSAKDDAAGSAIAARLSAEVAGLQQAGVNAGQASSMLQIADGAFQNVEDILTRAKSLSVQAGSEQISDAERSFLDQEFQALKTEIDRIAGDTEFNGTKLVDGAVKEDLADAQDNANINLAGVMNGTVSGAVTNLNSVISGVETTMGGSGFAANAQGLTGNNTTAKGNFNDGFLKGTGANKDGILGFGFQGVSLGNSMTLSQTVQGGMIEADLRTGSVSLKGAATVASGDGADAVAMLTLAATAGVMTAGGGTAAKSFTFMTTLSATENEVPDGGNLMLSGLNGAFQVTFSNAGGGDDVMVAANGFNFNPSSPLTLAAMATTGTFSGSVTLMVGSALDTKLGVADGAAITNGNSAGTPLDQNVLFSGQESMNFTFKVGTGVSAAEDEISVSIGGISTQALELDGVDISNKDNADAASIAVSDAIDSLQAKRSEVGAAQNRLDFAGQNVELTRENQEAARSELEDLNVAKAITEFSQQQLLVQAGTSTLSQANSLPQNLLQLFR